MNRLLKFSTGEKKRQKQWEEKHCSAVLEQVPTLLGSAPHWVTDQLNLALRERKRIVGRLDAAALSPRLTGAARAQQRRQEQDHQRQDLHVHLCAPLRLPRQALAVIVVCVCVCVKERACKREGGSTRLPVSVRVRVCTRCVWVCESVCICVFFMYLCASVTAPLRDCRKVFIWALPGCCVFISLENSSVCKVEQSCECADSWLATASCVRDVCLG